MPVIFPSVAPTVPVILPTFPVPAITIEEPFIAPTVPVPMIAIDQPWQFIFDTPIVPTVPVIAPTVPVIAPTVPVIAPTLPVPVIAIEEPFIPPGVPPEVVAAEAAAREANRRLTEQRRAEEAATAAVRAEAERQRREAPATAVTQLEALPTLEVARQAEITRQTEETAAAWAQIQERAPHLPAQPKVFVIDRIYYTRNGQLYVQDADFGRGEANAAQLIREGAAVGHEIIILKIQPM